MNEDSHFNSIGIDTPYACVPNPTQMKEFRAVHIAAYMSEEYHEVWGTWTRSRVEVLASTVFLLKNWMIIPLFE